MPFQRSIRKRQRQSPKFYLFDLGVQAALNQSLAINLQAGTYTFGNLFEQFIILEIVRLIHYYEKGWRISYLRTKDDAEIDLIIERPGEKTACIEIKSKTKISRADIRSLLSLGQDIDKAELFVFSRMEQAELFDGVHCLPWREGFIALGLGMPEPNSND